MKQSFRITLAALAVVAIANVGNAQDLPSYALSLDGTTSFETLAADAAVDLSGAYTASVTESDNPNPDGGGAQGWSISIAASGITIDEITDEGTDALAKFAGGFVQAGTTDRSGAGSECEGLLGAVQAYVLSFTQPITLDANATSSIAVLNCSGEGTSPAVGETAVVASLAFADGCQGPGQPVGNAVTWDGSTVTPEKGSIEISITTNEPPPLCPFEGYELQLLIANGETPDPEAPAQITAETAAGEVGTAEVIGSIRSAIDAEAGVQGWSLSVAAVENCSITAVDIAGTDAEALFSGGFEQTSLSDRSGEGSECEGFNGAVSAVVLSFTQPITLDSAGEQSVLRMDVEAGEASVEPEGEEATVVLGKIEWRDGCQGAGQPVSSVATVDGATVSFGCAQNVDLIWVTPPAPAEVGPFLPCDSNNDGDVNLADAVYTINALIRGGDPFACVAAADCNGDFMADISDAVSVAHGLFGLSTLPELVCTVVPAESIPAELLDSYTCDDASCE